MDEAIIGLAVVVPLVVLAGGILILLMAMFQRTKTLEMRHRERMAMIERGLMPSPESDPARFEAASRPAAAGPPRFTSLGIALVGIGFGLMLIIGFAGEAPGAAIGIGGAIAILGAAFIVNGYLQRNVAPPAVHGRSLSTTPRPPRLEPTDPPGPVGP
jgi:hypothetical protein